ncbi:hypothetical protein FA95DRAFT_1557547 [Auriscalpium vulgare]|uniref:Uncharacterized protein n=1 Tax=Auriscalpium vulgare TaxID=40419 RepID=A0ACB8RXR2_9AGAM|nr:hypothetical protein FA95DRAFT_1557547 [Auriscalpium vulgare]
MISRFSKSFFVIILLLLLVASVALLHPPARAHLDPWTGDLFGAGGVEEAFHAIPPSKTAPGAPESPQTHITSVGSSVSGGVIMPKLGNATAKAALGRATWKLLHTMTLRYPEHPTLDEREAFKSYIHLTSRLYPCGECATEFQALLQRFPPQTSSRRSASLWLCHVHNQVNERLKKPEFDCAHLDDEYDCGCGDDPIASPSPAANDPMDLERDPNKDERTGADLVKGGR